MPRPTTPMLSRDRIADAAIDLAERGRPFGVNAIARALGVTPSSLYNHVRGSDEIVELMRSRLMEDREQPPVGSTWEAYVESAVRSQRRMYGAHPSLVPLIVDKPIDDPSTLRSYDDLARVLSDAGFADDELLEVITMLDGVAIGFGLDLAGPDAAWSPDAGGGSDAAPVTPVLARAVAAAPAAGQRSERAFEATLRLLIDGLRLRLGARTT